MVGGEGKGTSKENGERRRLGYKRREEDGGRRGLGYKQRGW
jgi:hypothetical protein